MQSWMMGFAGAVLWVGFIARLPEPSVLLLMLGLAAAALRCQHPLARFVSGAACGGALALAYGDAVSQQILPHACVKQPVVIAGAVSSLPRHKALRDGRRYQLFVVDVDALSPAICAGPRRVMLSYYGGHEIIPGDKWRFDVSLKRPWGNVNPGSYNFQGWFAQQGIDAVGTVRKSKRAQLLGERAPLQSHHRLRYVISERIQGLPLSEESRGVLRAISVADKSGISPALWRLFQSLGINHLMVISGLHIGLAAAFAYALCTVMVRALPVSPSFSVRLPILCSVLLALSYAALAGFSLPAQRAAYMLAAFAIARLLGRGSGAYRNLLLASCLVLGLNPLAGLGSGFWLSFGAVAALLWLAPWQSRRSAMLRALQTHAYMALVMLPAGAWFFGGTSLVAMVANLLLIPLVGLLVVPLALLAVLALLCGWRVEALLWQCAAWPLEQLLPLAQTLMLESGHLVYQPLRGSLASALLCLFAVGLLVLPAGKRVRALSLLLILPLLLQAPLEGNTVVRKTQITVLDVGQGTAVVVQAGDHALLYDTGGGSASGTTLASAVVLPFLAYRGVSSLDTFIVSHWDNDHSAGVGDILDKLPIGRLRYGGSGPVGMAGQECVAGEAWHWPGGQRFQILSPAVDAGGSSNDSSCVLQIEVGPHRLLLPGDVERAGERNLVRYWGEALASDWLLVPHHGSQTSSSSTLLKWVRPRHTVVSSGYANPFGHPHSRVLERLRAFDARVHLSAVEGALTFTLLPEGKIEVQAQRAVQRRYWMFAE